MGHQHSGSCAIRGAGGVRTRRCCHRPSSSCPRSRGSRGSLPTAPAPPAAEPPGRAGALRAQRSRVSGTERHGAAKSFTRNGGRCSGAVCAAHRRGAPRRWWACSARWATSRSPSRDGASPRCHYCSLWPLSRAIKEPRPAIFQLDGSDTMCSATASARPAAEPRALGGAGRPEELVVLDTGSHIGRKG